MKRNIVYIGQPGCSSCLALLETTIAPLYEEHPESVSVHFKWDSTIERVNRRKTITRVPLIVVENDGEEEFRYSGSIGLDALRAIVECEREALTLKEVFDGDFE